jgi:NADH:ubiquinone oxidoreductase subunit E
MPPRAKPSRRRFIPKNQMFRHPRRKIVCRFCDTTAPTKEGLLWDDKIVSNLHEQLNVGRGTNPKDSLY